MTRIRAVAFDFDDTISDWPSAVERAARLLAGEPELLRVEGFSERFLALAWQLYPSRIPGSLFFEVHKVLERVCNPAHDPLALADRFRALLTPVAFADAATIAELAGRYELAVLSNNPYAPTGLDRLGLTGHFAAIIALEEASGLAKPHPHAFASLATALARAPEEVVYVGDSLIDDVAGALAAGMVAVWVDRGRTGLAAPQGAWRVESLAELPELLQTM